MADKLILTPAGIVAKAGWSGVEWQLDGFGEDRFVLRHAVPEPDASLLPDPERGDHVVPSVLLWAMQHGKDIVVHGQVSPKLLDGLETLQAIWQRWRPARYRTIAIQADEESELVPATADRPALFAFSGGVDGTFSLFRHLKGHAGRNTLRPGAALLVHGMDIPLAREDFFDGAAQGAHRMLSSTDVPLIKLKTNSRQLGQDWEDSYGLQLIGSFLVFQAGFAHGVKGSGEPYESLVLPWGSTPITDPLCATRAMAMVHDGCAADRTEKVHWLATNTTACHHLRVCWEGPELDRNCGECEKCVRTMLNFWAMGLPVPDAFPSQLTAAKIRNINLKPGPQVIEIKSLQRHARERHRPDDPVFDSLNHIIVRTERTPIIKRLIRRTKRLFL